MSDKIPNMDYDADEVIENFKSKFKWPTKSTDVEVVVTPPKLPLKILISFLITAIVGFGVYYMMIPALNFKSTDFYVFLLILIAVFCASAATLPGIPLCQSPSRKKHQRHGASADCKEIPGLYGKDDRLLPDLFRAGSGSDLSVVLPAICRQFPSGTF